MTESLPPPALEVLSSNVPPTRGQGAKSGSQTFLISLARPGPARPSPRVQRAHQGLELLQLTERQSQNRKAGETSSGNMAPAPSTLELAEGERGRCAVVRRCRTQSWLAWLSASSLLSELAFLVSNRNASCLFTWS